MSKVFWIIFTLASSLTSDRLPSVRCFQCSDFPSEPEDRDEPVGPCPGWLRPPIIFPAMSVYDGCMTIILSNGSIVAQSGVVYDYCLQLQVRQNRQLCNVLKKHCLTETKYKNSRHNGDEGDNNSCLPLAELLDKDKLVSI